jgi:spore coat polysaccharide biosynthesis protein SpsF (cytidylyltransferase family)
VSFFPDDLSRSVWVSLDHREDYDLIRAVHEELFPRDPAYGAEAIIAACKARPQMTRACLNLRGW